MIEKMPAFKPALHFFVCINAREGENVKPSCGPLINEAMVKELKLWVRQQGYTGKVQITKTGCLGGCNSDGGVVVVYPSGEFFKGFTDLDSLKQFISGYF
jgi:predicted metal-binding protein